MSFKGRVVNINHEPFQVYIGRAGKGQDGYFGNPIKPKQLCPICNRKHGRGGTIECFERYARSRLAVDGEYRKRVRELHGLTLGCFCDVARDQRCHGEVLLQLAYELVSDTFEPPNPIQLFPALPRCPLA